RQFPEVLAGPSRKPFANGSGRLELAQAIASRTNPLTARVFANRVWIGHFGQGLVRTPSDFGLRSDPPTHPELLDWLASRFIRDRWSVKKLHKTIMMSAAYQQLSISDFGIRNSESRTGIAQSAKLFGVSIPHSALRIPHSQDLENRWLGHQNRRRLDFEAMRDSLLFTAGRLDLTMGGRSVDILKSPFSTRRSIYGTIDRSNFPGTFRSFDVASPDQHSPQRFQTTVPQQALFLLNSPFVVEQARTLANRGDVKSATAPHDRIARLYRAALGRNPTTEELALARAFIGDGKSTADFGPWEQLAQVLLMSNEFLFVD
ncbi:MAG TPA: DUF1553 domain-containing protein, partial [Urbifossiella sp.]|nr:DUF1553 domain-containing protein [Urbifossiella sp.]